MAGTSLLALIDDIATLLDDIAVLSKVAAKKTAGVLGDDLALNAEQVTGVKANRELPVVWAVAKGSFFNKLMLVPAALLISAVAPWAITILLMIGGAYLCFEGFEKIAHKFLHDKSENEKEHSRKLKAVADPKMDLVALENKKVKGAIRTDFVLSAEIIVITLGSVQDSPFATQVIVVSSLAIAFTVGVYGIVAGIVKLDDAGLYLIKTATESTFGKFKTLIGQGILGFAPYLMKGLSIVGTAAMFLVGGNILVHGIPMSHDVIHHAEEAMHSIPAMGTILAAITPTLLNAIAGIIAGGLVLLGVNGGKAAFTKLRTNR